MRKLLYFIFLAISLNLFSQETIHKNQLEEKNTKKINETFFVSAKSGLNYRDAPKGKVLGKYSLNTELQVIEYTNNTDQIKDEGKLIKGEWVGVEKGTDTVYVFNAFLSLSKYIADINIFYVSPYFKERNGDTRTAFLNVSEIYFDNYNTNNNTLLKEDDLKKDTINLNSNQRKKFFKTTNIHESDKVFIYELDKDSIHVFNIKNLPVIACLNIYGGPDYEFGFDLKKLKISYENLTYIGKENPFQTGKAKQIIWRKITSNQFPKKFNSIIVSQDIRFWFDKIEAGESYIFSNNNLNYYIQNLEENGNVKHRYIVVINTITNKIIYEDVLIDSESSYLTPLTLENENYEYEPEMQLTGAIFKNKPPVLYGLLGFSFGCPGINFLDKSEPPIIILCDNRH